MKYIVFAVWVETLLPAAAAKYSLPQWWQILRKQFLETSDWFTAYNIGSSLICGIRN